MYVLGLTGGIACGKSTVVDLFQSLGAYTIDADQIAKQATKKGTQVYRNIVDAFGKGILLENGEIDRKYLAHKVFNDPTSLKTLNSLVHPTVYIHIREMIQSVKDTDSQKMIIVDIPLLYETHVESMFDQVMVVHVALDVQLHRLMERNRLSKEDALARIQAQMPLEEKKEYADILIDNGGTLTDTVEQVKFIWKKLNNLVK